MFQVNLKRDHGVGGHNYDATARYPVADLRRKTLFTLFVTSNSRVKFYYDWLRNKMYI